MSFSLSSSWGLRRTQPRNPALLSHLLLLRAFQTLMTTASSAVKYLQEEQRAQCTRRANTCTHTPYNTCTHTPYNTCTHTPYNTCTHTPYNTCTHTPYNTCTHTPYNTCTHTPYNTCTHTPYNTCTHTPYNTCTHTPYNTCMRAHKESPSHGMSSSTPKGPN